LALSPDASHLRWIGFRGRYTASVVSSELLT
jgi:hypothetical protein